VYAAEQQLTGALFLHVPGGAMHSVRLEDGRAVKVQMGDGFAPLRDLLIEAGLVDETTPHAVCAVPSLLGDSLGGGNVTREAIDKVIDRQFLLRMARLFGLPSTTRYTYFADMHETVDDGAPLLTVHPLAVLWAGLREHAVASAMMAAIVKRVGDAPLRLHPRAATHRLMATAQEQAVLDRMRQTHPSLRGLIASSPNDEPMIRWMVYALVIMRFVDFGTDALPLFPEQPPVASAVASTSSSTSAVTLARIRLQQNVSRRFTAAAPDDVGDGERIKPRPRTRKRARTTDGKTGASQSTMTEATSSRTTAVDSEVEQMSDGDTTSAIPPAPTGQTDTTRPAHALYGLAIKRLEEGDRKGALAACHLARQIDPDEPDYAVLETWIRAVLGGTNLESCVDDLDKLLQQRPRHVPALFYRGYLRRRIGDEAGASSDLRRVLELDPTHQDALRELKRLERRAPAKRPSGLYKS